MAPPYPFQSQWLLWYPSTNHLMTPIDSIVRVNFSLLFPFRYFNALLSFPQSYSSGFLALVVRKRRLKLTIMIYSMGVIKWFIDGSHNTHWYCKGHDGAMMLMGCGDISSYSRRIKVNTRSSTETKLVSVDAYMPEILWSLYFIQTQECGVKYA